MYYAAVDIGGTKTSIAIIDEDINIICTKTFNTTAGNGCFGTVRMCLDKTRQMCIENMIDFKDILRVGTASPGPIDLKTGTIINIPTLGWTDEPIKHYFEDLYKKETVIQNDTNAAALGEYIFGKNNNVDCLVYITVSTGIGCGIVINGDIYSGSSSAAGELGHINVVNNGRKCACGNRGCLEAYASGKSIAELASKRCGVKHTTKEVFDEFRKGDRDLGRIIIYAGQKIGYAISLIYQIVDPSIVVIGGSVMKDFDLIYPFISESASKFTEINTNRKINIIKSEFNGEQILLGMAYLAKR